MGETNQVGLSFPLLLLIVIAMLSLAIAVVAFFLVYQKRLFRQQKRIREIEAEQQKQLMQAVMSAQEEERRKLASELHDGIGSLLSAGKLYIKKIERADSIENSRPLLSEAGNILDESLSTMRELSSNLSPASLQRYGLIAALEDLTQRVQKLQTHKVELLCTGETIRLAEEMESSIFRIAQELINNTLKHAEASEIKLELNFLAETIQFSYSDNGRGFDLEAKKQEKRRSFGLINIESRARVLDAQLHFDTSPGAGLHLLLVIPKNMPIHVYDQSSSS
ncbi:MAG: sensor histidine kinase [Bacteroidota bacterium]